MLIGSALVRAGISRSALPAPDLGRLSLDNWLKLKASIDQRARYQFVFGNIKALYVKERRYNEKQAALAAYNLIRSPQYAYSYLLFIYYGEAASQAASQGSTTVDAKPQNTIPDAPISTGSGFFISNQGHFVTNHHVIEDTTKVRVRVGEKTYSAKIIRVDERIDLALLKVDIKSGFTAIPISKSVNVSLGDRVFTIGFPMSRIQGILPKYTEGTISSLAGIRDEPSRFQISVPLQPGNSGGLLVNSRGHVIAVVVSGLSTRYFLKNEGVAPQVVNYAIKSSFLLGFLEGVTTAYVPATNANSKYGKDAIKRTQDSIGHVIAQ